ncbi:MAG TPA: glycoside hydrolase family 127 protein, partial [Candidatus Methylomirabilis sp.]|nr:glycoside hydrolase family 127 protein [Candidatus Methylomirabilis sp.]
IESTRGCLAIERGPVVYCLEQADHPGVRVDDVEIDASVPLGADWEQDRLDGVTVIRGTGFEPDISSWNRQLYRPAQLGRSRSRKHVELIAIPYYAWANREPGAMRVWIPRAHVRV